MADLFVYILDGVAYIFGEGTMLVADFIDARHVNCGEDRWLRR